MQTFTGKHRPASRGDDLLIGGEKGAFQRLLRLRQRLGAELLSGALNKAGVPGLRDH